MSIEARGISIQAAPAIRGGIATAPRGEAGRSVATMRPEAPKPLIHFPKPGEKPAFMSVSRMNRITDKPIVDISKSRNEGPRMAIPESRSIKTSGLVSELLGKPITETARKGDKTFAQALREKQVSMSRVGDKPTGNTGETNMPKIDIHKSTPIPERHTFYSPTAKPEMTGRVTIQPVEKKPVVGEQIQRETRTPIEIQNNRAIPAKEVRPSPIKETTIREKPSQPQPEMSKAQAVETLQIYAKTSRNDRKLTPEVKQAFGRVIEDTQTPLTGTVAALWQEDTKNKPRIGVDPEAVTYLKRVIERNPNLQRNIDTQLGLATTVMANYAAVGYPITEASRTVLKTLEVTLRREVRKTLTAQTKPAFPETDEEDGFDKDPNPEETQELEDVRNEKDITFQRAEEVNDTRIKELLQIAETTGEIDPESEVKMVSPILVSQLWKLTTENVSPLIRDGGTEQRRVDGSWDEIGKELSSWETMSIDEFRMRVISIVPQKTAVAIGENPYAKDEDVTRVLTVPAEYTTFRMNSLQQEY